MKHSRIRRRIVAASLFVVLAGSPAWAEQGAPPGELETLKRMIQEVISKNEELRRRIRDLEAVTGIQPPATTDTGKEAAKEAPKDPTKEAPKGIATQPTKEAPGEVNKELLKEFVTKPAAGWWNKIQLGGAVEVDVLQTKNFAGVERSDIQLSAAEFDIEAKLVDWAKAKLAVSFDSGKDKFTLEEGLITLGGTDTFPYFLKAGKGTVPFGFSTGTTVAAKLEDTLTLTDPLDLEVFDTSEVYVSLGAKLGGFTAGAYATQGHTNDVGGGGKRLNRYGAFANYSVKHDIVSFTAGLSMINSVFDSDGLQEAFPGALTPKTRYVPGVAGYVKLGRAGLSLVAAYYGALRQSQFTQDDSPVHIQPKAWHAEAGYTREIFGAKTFGALSYSETSGLAGTFAKTRKIATVGRWFLDNLLLTFDYAHDQDYARAEGGTGNSADRFTLRLTYEW